MILNYRRPQGDILELAKLSTFNFPLSTLLNRCYFNIVIINVSMLQFPVVLKEIVQKLYGQSLEDILIEFPKEVTFGDIALPIAMQLAKPLQKNPRDVATAIVEEIKSRSLPEVAATQVAGPGFINITFTDAYLIELIDAGFTSMAAENAEKKILLEYGAENIAKSMTVGHLRSNIIGQACANLYRALGWNTVTDNHLGDWGLQFGKLIVAYRMWGDETAIKADPINELVKIYIKFHEEEEKDEALTDQARAEFAKLEQGDPENKRIWQWFYEESMREFHELHEILGVTHDTELGESFYTPWLNHIIELCKEKGITTTSDDGAVYIDFGKAMPPFYIQKKDGSSLYSTRDLATIEYRLTQYPGLKRMVYFVGSDQKLHFDSLFATAKKLGWYCHFTLAAFGLVSLPDGKMSTRKGRVVYLRQLIDEGIERAQNVLAERKVELSDEEKRKLARKLAIGAIKFNDLVHNRTGDIVFSWDNALNFEGDTATYLQYTYTRIQSVLRKGEYIASTKREFSYTLPIEHHILSLLSRFPTMVQKAADAYQPHVVAQYLLAVTALFNQFYNDVTVIKAEPDQKAARLFLLDKVATIVKDGLALLGIEVPDRM